MLLVPAKKLSMNQDYPSPSCKPWPPTSKNPISTKHLFPPDLSNTFIYLHLLQSKDTTNHSYINFIDSMADYNKNIGNISKQNKYMNSFNFIVWDWIRNFFWISYNKTMINYELSDVKKLWSMDRIWINTE